MEQILWVKYSYHTHKSIHTKEGGKEEIIRGDSHDYGIVYGDSFYLVPIPQGIYINMYSFYAHQSYFRKKKETRKSKKNAYKMLR